MVSFRSSFRPRAGERAQTNLRVVLPVSGGSTDQRLLDSVARLCHRRKADVTLVYVVEVEQSMPLDAELPERAAGVANSRNTVLPHRVQVRADGTTRVASVEGDSPAAESLEALRKR